MPASEGEGAEQGPRSSPPFHSSCAHGRDSSDPPLSRGRLAGRRGAAGQLRPSRRAPRMEYSCKRLKAKKSMALNDQKQVEKLNKIKNISTEEILYGLQMKDHSLQPSALDIICKMSTRRKRASSVSKENTQCKGIKLSDEIKKKSICTMSKKEESLLGKIKRMVDERMDILNSDFINQKLESLNRRVEQLQCKNNHEEIAKALLKKVSKLERRIDAVIAFLEELFSKMALHQTMLPSAGNPSTVLNGLGPSAFFPDIVNTPTNSSNILLLSPYTGITSAHVSEYISSDGSHTGLHGKPEVSKCK